MDDRLQVVVSLLRELEGDVQVPKQVKVRIAATIKLLEVDSAELRMNVSRAVSELEELAEDSNMQPFTRTQLFNIVSQLEGV